MLAVLERKERIVEAEINILEYQEANRECSSCKLLDMVIWRLLGLHAGVAVAGLAAGELRAWVLEGWEGSGRAALTGEWARERRGSGLSAAPDPFCSPLSPAHPRACRRRRGH